MLGITSITINLYFSTHNIFLFSQKNKIFNFFRLYQAEMEGIDDPMEGIETPDDGES